MIKTTSSKKVIYHKKSLLQVQSVKLVDSQYIVQQNYQKVYQQYLVIQILLLVLMNGQYQFTYKI